ncbi:MAG: hypothetical protein ABIZ49_09850, partial [Opitutaceae bacterium]
MQSVLFLLSIVAGVVLIAGAIVTVAGLRSAPEGHEDENGFHFADVAHGSTPVNFPALAEARPVAVAAYRPNYELA